MVALSVIVPFYDETAFLTDALRSVLTQGIADLEIIVVNDNPEKFSEHDIRPLVPTGPGDATITILSQPENRGLSAARNTGLDAAKGTFIAFLDADDYYTTTGLFDQFQMARDSQADLTHAQTYFTQKGSPALSLLPRDKLLFGTRKMVSGLGAAEEAHFIVSTWSSIYRHAFLKRNKLRFDPALPKFEDRLFVVHCVTAASKIAFLGAPTRVWRQRAGSISVSATSPDFFSRFSSPTGWHIAILVQLPPRFQCIEPVPQCEADGNSR
jgi:glycosyltransferase involved in cell wall biosynthesis